MVEFFFTIRRFLLRMPVFPHFVQYSPAWPHQHTVQLVMLPRLHSGVTMSPSPTPEVPHPLAQPPVSSEIKVVIELSS